MKKQIRTDAVPAAIGPYSQAIEAGGFLFYSGQIPLHPASGVMVAGGIVEQTRQVMANMQAMLQGSGRDFTDVVKTTIYLTDLADFAGVNDIYGGYFQHTPPARACVQVAALPRGAAIEIDWIALA